MMEAFIAQWGILILIGIGVLYVLTRGRRYLDEVKSKAKDAALRALMREMKLDKLPDPEKIAKIAKIAKAIKNANPKKLAGKAIEVLAAEVIAIPDKKIPDLVDETDDIDGLGAALNKAIKSETRREKWRRGGKKAVAIGAKILGSII